MEPWKEELYHAGILSNFRSRVKNITGTSSTIGRKGVGLGGWKVGGNSTNGRTVGSSANGNTGREWKEHKYIRKEGNRYIYPDDLKKKTEKPNRAEQYEKRLNKNKNDSYWKKMSRQDDIFNLANPWKDDKPWDKDYHKDKYGSANFKGKEAKSKIKSVEDTVNRYQDKRKSRYTPPNHGLSNVKTITTERDFLDNEPGRTKNGTRLVNTTTLEYRKGKSFVDKMFVTSRYDYMDPVSGNDHMEIVGEDAYVVYEYGYISQLKNSAKKVINKGKSYINSLRSKKK